MKKTAALIALFFFFMSGNEPKEEVKPLVAEPIPV